MCDYHSWLAYVLLFMFGFSIFLYEYFLVDFVVESHCVTPYFGVPTGVDPPDALLLK